MILTRAGAHHEVKKPAQGKPEPDQTLKSLEDDEFNDSADTATIQGQHSHPGQIRLDVHSVRPLGAGRRADDAALVGKRTRVLLFLRSLVKVFDTRHADDVVAREPVLRPPKEAPIADACASDVLLDIPTRHPRETIQRAKLREVFSVYLCRVSAPFSPARRGFVVDVNHHRTDGLLDCGEESLRVEVVAHKYPALSSLPILF